MMVPRAFLFTSVPSPKTSRHYGKSTNLSSPDFVAVQDFPALDFPDKEASHTTHTSPVIIPPKRPRVTSMQTESVNRVPRTPKSSRTVRRAPSATSSDRPLPSSIATILEATAIPPPRRKRAVRESRKLPRGNHVQDFSQMLMEGIQERDDHLMEGTGNTVLDLLLSPPEDNDNSAAASDCGSETPSFSTRSMSLESTPSLEVDLESPSSFPVPLTPSMNRSPSERRYRRLSNCENCAFDHPLLETEHSDTELEPAPPRPLSRRTLAKSPTPSRTFPRLGSTFKSNLTASLRAIKNAAQTVSTFATPSVQPDDFLTRSLFTITPEMTDDRRPPPMKEPPSPELRRYLNPITVSPAEMYAYQDYPHEAVDSHNCPVSVQMQTYHRSGKRGSRKRGFHLAGSEGRDRKFLPFDPEIPPMTRQREPRENCDFLRQVVLELNMRRKGKLRDDIPTRARTWLPPRKGNPNRLAPYDSYEDVEENAVPSRWVGISAEGI